MTEKEWATCRSPWRMLDYHRMKKHPRRLRLLAVACARRAIPTDAPPLTGDALDVVERYADGTATRSELLTARKAVRAAVRDKLPVARALTNLTDDAMEGMTVTIDTVRGRSGGAAQCGLIRCIFPFRHVTVDPVWLTSTGVALARQMYDTRDFSPIPILADALQDAGCDNADILAHCRGPGPHVRECWVVDLVLGKG